MAVAIKSTTAIKITCPNTLANRCCRPRPLLMDPPQYFLSSVRIGSFPIIVDEIAALQTRPSVVSRQFAGFASCTFKHSFLITLARSWCLLNQSLIEFLLAWDKSPEPVSSTILTIGLGGSAFLQPAGAPTRTRIGTAIHGLFMSSPCGVSIFSGRSRAVAFQTLAQEPLYPLVPSESAPPDTLVYSEGQSTSTAAVPSAVPPAVRQSDSPPQPPPSARRRPRTSREAGRAPLVRCSIACLASPPPATCSSSYRARSATISCSR